MKALTSTFILSAFLLGAAVPLARADIEVKDSDVVISDLTIETTTPVILSAEEKAQLDELLLAEIERQNQLAANSF